MHKNALYNHFLSAGNGHYCGTAASGIPLFSRRRNLILLKIQND